MNRLKKAMTTTRNDTLKILEAVEANLFRLDELWSEIEPLLPAPRQVAVSDPGKYVERARLFRHFVDQMPAVDGYKLE